MKTFEAICSLSKVGRMWKSFLLALGFSGICSFSGYTKAYQAEVGSIAETQQTSEWSVEHDSDLPNILILGDSISIGYGLPVKRMLEGKANVYRPFDEDLQKPENCQGTTNGVASIDRWLGKRKWDLIHFNFGLHDLKHVDAVTGKNSKNTFDPQQATVAQYSRQLNEIIGKLKNTGAQLLFATTTPVVPNSKGPHRDSASPPIYNKAALELMAKHQISVNDLYSAVLPHLERYQLPQNVHFKEDGSLFLAEKVVEAIERELPLKKTVSHESKPNIIFIFADDQCFETIREYGLTDIDTPNLDRLVKEGVSFANAYNMGAWNGAVCEASRTCLNMGRFLWRARDALDASRAGAHKSWAQLMTEAGYETYMSGKWHVGIDSSEIFDHTKHIRPGMPNQTPAGYNRPKNPEDYEKGWKPWDKKYEGFWKGGTHWSEVLAQDGIDFIEQASEKDNPFFMYLAFNAPHDPRQAPKEYVDRYPLSRVKVPENYLPMYEDMGPKGIKVIRDENLAPFPRTEYAIKVNRQEYYASITHMDAQIGRILDALEQSGKIENTWIIFSADHGLAVGRHGLVGKQNMYEHSMRAPFILWGPDLVGGVIRESPIYIQDAMATALDLAGSSALDEVDYRSVLPLVRDASAEHYDFIYGAYMGEQRMMRRGDLKLIAYPLLQKLKLFDLSSDPHEMNDLSKDPFYADTIAELTLLLEQTMDDMGDPMTSLSAADYYEHQKRPQWEKH